MSLRLNLLVICCLIVVGMSLTAKEALENLISANDKYFEFYVESKESRSVDNEALKPVLRKAAAACQDAKYAGLITSALLTELTEENDRLDKRADNFWVTVNDLKTYVGMLSGAVIKASSSLVLKGFDAVATCSDAGQGCFDDRPCCGLAVCITLPTASSGICLSFE